MLLLSILLFINHFITLSIQTLVITLLIVGLSVFVSLFIYQQTSDKKSSKPNLIDKFMPHYPLVVICFVIFDTILYSITISTRQENLFKIEELRSFITLQWVIFTIDVTVFLIWRTIILKGIIVDVPKHTKKDCSSLYHRMQYHHQCELVLAEFNRHTSSIILLITALFSIVVATTQAFMPNITEILYVQIISIISFSFCIIALIYLVPDMIIKLGNEMDRVKDSMSTPNEQIEDFSQTEEKYYLILDLLKNLDYAYNEDQRKEVHAQLIDALFMPEKSDTDMKNGSSHDQL